MTPNVNEKFVGARIFEEKTKIVGIEFMLVVDPLPEFQLEAKSQ